MELHRIEHPQNTLSALQRKELLPALTDIARDGFGTEMTEEDVENHVLGGDFLYLLRNADGLAGFSSYNRKSIAGSAVLYLNGIVVKRSAQRKGSFRLANSTALSEEAPDFFAMRTQNPVIYGATRSLVGRIYPGGERAPAIVQDIAAVLGGPTFDRETFVCRKTYGTCLYDFIPAYRDANEFFERELKLDYEAGDSVIIVGALR